MNTDRQDLKRLAKKTLGRAENDEREISPVYLAHLRHLLRQYPSEHEFKIALDNGSGAIQCLVCNRNVAAGNGDPEENGVDIFGSMANYQEHLTSDIHIRRKGTVSSAANSVNERHVPRAGRLQPKAHISNSTSTSNSRPKDVSSSSRTLFSSQGGVSRPSATPAAQTLGMMRSESAKNEASPTRHLPTTSKSRLQENSSSNRSFVPSASKSSTQTSIPSTSSVRHSAGTATRPNQQDIDRDYLYALSLQQELDGQDQADDLSTPSSVVQAPAKTNPEPIDLTDESESDQISFTEMYRAQLDEIMANHPQEIGSYRLFPEGAKRLSARCGTCNFSVVLPATGSLTSAFDEIASGMQDFKGHLDSPHHQRKRNDAIAVHQGMAGSSISQQPGGVSHPSAPSMDHPSLNPTASSMAQSSTPVSLGKRKMESYEFENNPIYNKAPIANTAYNGQTPGAAGPSRLTSSLSLNNLANHFIRPLAQFLPGSTTTTNTHPFDERRVADWDAYYGKNSRGHSSRDFEINYDEEGPIRQEDIDDATQEEQFKQFMRNALNEFENNVTVGDAVRKLGLRNKEDILDGLTITLMAHQCIGVSWMVDQECDPDKRGGILADAMGLGKTVQMIGTIVKNRPEFVGSSTSSIVFSRETDSEFHVNSSSSDKGKSRESDASGIYDKRRASLILAPASLLQQWYEECIEKTTNGLLRVHIHHGKDKLKDKRQLENHDIIITSYHTLLLDLPKRSEEDDAGVQPGPLVKARWLRVVIDEAQNIRNKGTRISNAVTKLDATYRWALTGTPVTNNLGDIFGLIRFLRLRPYNDWKLFNGHIGKVQKRDATKAGQRAQTLLKPHLLRRTKDSTIDGVPVLQQLRPKTIEVVELEFDKDERGIYEILEGSSKKVVNKFLKEKTVMKHYDMILVMILRLRQLCCHPSLVTEKAEDESDETKSLNTASSVSELDRARKVMGAVKVQELQNRLHERFSERIDNENAIEHEECPICFEPMMRKHRVLSCGHEFCIGCVNELLSGGEGREAEEEGSQCPMCRHPFDKSKVFNSTIFEKEEEDGGAGDVSDGRSSKRRKVDDDVDRIFEGVTDFEELVPSTKMKSMLETIVETMREHPGDKTIVYSQWTSLLDLVQRLFQESGIKTLSYTGRMNRIARTETIQKFKNDDTYPVLLVSLKCGGVGLNLTRANRVINLDLAWNYATEAQAYDRVHRIGQLKDVVVRRLIIKDTIEERLVRLQARKQGFSDAALGEGSVGKIKKLNAREIANLFGLDV